MEALLFVLSMPLGAAGAVLLERLAVRGVRAVLLAHSPLSGEHTDSCVYHRNLWAPDQPDALTAVAVLAFSGVLAVAGLQFSPWWLLPAELLWSGALVWDLWAWERVAGSVKFVSWRRGWQHSARRVAVSDLREVHVAERRRVGRVLPHGMQPASCSLVLVMNDGKAVKLPRTGTLFGGEAAVEDLANFVRMQMEVVADNRRRAVADKRAAARRAMAPPPPPAHPATKLDPQALPRGAG